MNKIIAEYGFDISKRSKNGKLIVVEGPDGIGKTTLIKNLELYLKASSKNPLVLANPNPKKVKYDKIKQMLKEEKIQNTDQLQQLMLMNFIDLFNTDISTHLKNKPDNIVILDRWIISSIIYNIIEDGWLYKIISGGSWIWDGFHFSSKNDFLSKESRTILIDFYYFHKILTKSSIYPYFIIQLVDKDGSIIENVAKDRIANSNDPDIYDKNIEKLKEINTLYNSIYEFITNLHKPIQYKDMTFKYKLAKNMMDEECIYRPIVVEKKENGLADYDKLTLQGIDLMNQMEYKD